MVKVLPQVTWILVTLAKALPLPALTTQVCVGLEGCVFTVTTYAPPLAMDVLKVNGPLAVMARSSPPLSSRMSPVPLRPITVPAIVKGPVGLPPPLPGGGVPPPPPGGGVPPPPVPGGVFRPLQADRANEMIIKNKSDLWLGFITSCFPRYFDFRGCKACSKAILTPGGTGSGAPLDTD
jgi:hypothetical protein